MLKRFLTSGWLVDKMRYMVEVIAVPLARTAGAVVFKILMVDSDNWKTELYLACAHVHVLKFTSPGMLNIKLVAALNNY